MELSKYDFRTFLSNFVSVLETKIWNTGYKLIRFYVLHSQKIHCSAFIHLISADQIYQNTAL